MERLDLKDDQISIVIDEHNREMNAPKIRSILFMTCLRNQICENAMPVRKYFMVKYGTWYTAEPDSTRTQPRFNKIKILCIE